MIDSDTQKLAERIARLLQESEANGDDFLRSSLEKINHRLDVIESSSTLRNSSEISHLPLTIYQSNHTSQDRFVNLAELADEVVNGSPNEKACPFEPTGKPCDNCAMCNSRGF